MTGCLYLPSIVGSAISNGKNKVAEISDFIHEDRSKVSKYLITLQTMRLIEKKVPCGESNDSRKGIYVITDNFYKFWFRYEFTNNRLKQHIKETWYCHAFSGERLIVVLKGKWFVKIVKDGKIHLHTFNKRCILTILFQKIDFKRTYFMNTLLTNSLRRRQRRRLLL